MPEDRCVAGLPDEPNSGEEESPGMVLSLKFDPVKGIRFSEERGREKLLLPKAVEAAAIPEQVKQGLIIQTAPGAERGVGHVPAKTIIVCKQAIMD